jgi:hypothetical protein
MLPIMLNDLSDAYEINITYLVISVTTREVTRGDKWKKDKQYNVRPEK